MADTTTGERPPDRSVPELGSELKDLVLAYIKQETLGPLRGLLRFVALGTAGSVLLGTGLVLLDLAGLRAMQEEAGGPGGVFYGAHSWMPYAVCAVGSVIVVALAALRILRGGGKR